MDQPRAARVGGEDAALAARGRGMSAEERWCAVRLALLFAVLLAPYLLVRALFWRKTTVLEGHDSTTFLSNLVAFRSGDLGAIIGLNPDSTPFYPFVGALFSLPGWSPETAARLASLSFSVLLLVAVLALAFRLGGTLAAAAAGLLLALNPALVPLSYSVFSEPTYIATVYVGLWLFFSRYDRPTAWTGALLGLVFGLGFLNRLEGLVFLAAIPVLQALHFIVADNRSYGPGRLGRWVLCFVATFSLLAAPQIWRVSSQMGGLAMNGREAWSYLLLSEGEATPEARLYGLDYSPSQINLEYVWAHPDARRALGGAVNPLDLIKHAVGNLDRVRREFLPTLAGPVVVGLFAIGMLALVGRRRRYFDGFLVFALLGTMLLVPLFQSNLLLRHVAVLAPLLLVGAGVGFSAVEASLRESLSRVPVQRLILAGITGLLLLTWALPLARAYRTQPNSEYDPVAIQEAARVLAAHRDTDGEQPIVVTRKHYITLESGAAGVSLPFTDYPGLLEFLRLRNADFLFLEHAFLRDRPFASAFTEDGVPPHFALIYRAEDSRGRIVELYRFVPGAAADQPAETEMQEEAA